MSSISVSSLVLGSLSVEVEGSNSTLALSVLGTAPASLTIELGTPGPSGVLYATAPLTYDGTTWTVGMDTSYFLRSPAVAAEDGQIPAWDAATSRPVWIDNAARTLFLVGVNKTGATIPKGSAVYVSGGQGAFPIISLAQANSEATSARTIGITTAAIANNAQGNVVVAGLATKLDTSAYPEGQTLYLSPSTPGGFVTSLPTQPLHGVLIGYVTRSNNNNGAIEVHVQNYQELQELSDVLITSKTNGDLLVYNSASGVWVNSSVATLGLLTTSAAAATYQTIAGMSAYQTVAAMSAYLTTANAASIYQTQAAMSAYLTTSAASATYQTLAGMSAYLTTADAATTYQTQAGMSSYLTTSAASSTYLTQANAASTYQTLAGMSSYLTTASAASTYLAKTDNLASLSSVATARANLGLGTAAIEPATKLVPTGGTTGQVLAKASNANWDLTWATAGGGGGGGGGTITSYLTPGDYTYTIPTGATQLLVLMWGAGGGGGSGARNVTSANRTGGSGGGHGGFSAFNFNASQFTSPINVSVAQGGIGAIAINSDSSPGVAAQTNFSFTRFATNYFVQNGNVGNGGSITATSSTGPAGRTANWNIGSATGTPAGSGIAGPGGGVSSMASYLMQVPTPGGGGGGGVAGSTLGPRNGAAGGGRTAAGNGAVGGYAVFVSGGAGGIPGTSAPTAGPSVVYPFGGLGGGGGGYATGTAGQAGANGSSPGGGGGGGGGSDNGFNSGAGGNGGDGAVIIIAY